MNLRHFATVLAVLALAACETPRPKAGGSFEYEIPAFMTRLTMPNFDYVKFGVTGEAAMEPIRKKMFRDEQIGLVNKALKQILAQLPQDNGAYGLVNVVSDISTQKIFRGVQDANGTRENLERVTPNLLVLRADIVRFRNINLERVLEKEFDKALGPPLGMHLITPASMDALAEQLALELDARQNTLQARADDGVRQVF